eukprot:evm.model.scf_465EXC.3 EVM.evm.TU.scf_465EXC.3   scf_465EXC:23544-28438(-)
MGEVIPGGGVELSVGREEAETAATLPEGIENEPKQGPADGDELPNDAGMGQGKYHKVQAFKPSTDLGTADVDKHYAFDLSLVPEAFTSYYKAEVPEGLGPMLPSKGGCRALEQEIQRMGKPVLVARDVFLTLQRFLSKDESGFVVLNGLPGCGKSILLAGLVEWARKQKWVVLYVPSAFAMTTDLYFFQRPGVRCWDTPNCARDLLRSVLDAHGDQLTELKRGWVPGTGMPDLVGVGETLADLCKAGVDAALQQPTMTVDATIHLLHEFLHVDHGMQKLVVIDDYNALFWHTTYVEWINDHTRRPIEVENLALAREFRLSEGAPAHWKCHVVVAPTHSAGIRRTGWTPKEGTILRVPKLVRCAWGSMDGTI